MTCYRPLQAYQSQDGGIHFHENKRTSPVRTLQLPCGQCIGCRLDRSRQWAIRCMHEKQQYEHNQFATFTYREDTLPPNNNLNHRDYQLFTKRLRKRYAGQTIRYYMCGEYGEQTGRPHYHAILYNLHLTDRKYYATGESGERIYTSKTLDEIWQLGECKVGNVTFQSAAYVARYITSKITGPLATLHYADPDTGEMITPEYNHMSLKPGIGYNFLQKYTGDLYPKGKTIMNGHEVNTPKYYDKHFKRIDQLAYEAMQYQRHQEALTKALDNTPERLAVREIVQKASAKLLKRPI